MKGEELRAGGELERGLALARFGSDGPYRSVMSALRTSPHVPLSSLISSVRVEHGRWLQVGGLMVEMVWVVW